jgi:hypothetical protein
MTPSQIHRREALLTRNDAALDRWPHRSGPEFAREMTAVAEGLYALASEVDATQGEALERSRNWRFVGNAYFDLADGKDLRHLRLADGAYRNADALLGAAGNAFERMKLDYSYGHTLFHLSNGKDLELLREARRRYASALEIARTEMPAGVNSAKTALANADRVIDLLTQAEGLPQQIAELQREVAAGAAEPEPSPPGVDWLLSLRGPLGKLADLERRLQSQPESVSDADLLSAAKKVDNLKPTTGSAATQPGWDVFHRKYSAMLYPHLQKRGLLGNRPAPPAWDPVKATEQLMARYRDSSSKLETVTFVRNLFEVVEQLEQGLPVGEEVLRPLLAQMDAMANAVHKLATEHPQLPGQFERGRQRLQAALRKRSGG